jgi:hypothetical protein
VGDENDPEAVAYQLWTGLHGYLTLRSLMSGLQWPSNEEFMSRLFEAHVGRSR